MAHDVFISHSSKDKPTADAACAVLESRGIRCWIAPRDITPGADWSESIIDAINDSRAMVLLFSHHANESPQIKREVERAVNRSVPIIPMRLEDVMPTKSLEYFISTPHWLDAFTAPLEEHLEYLANTVQRLLDDEPAARPPAPPQPAPRPFITRHLKAIGIIAATVLAISLLAIIAFQDGNDGGEDNTNPQAGGNTGAGSSGRADPPAHTGGQSGNQATAGGNTSGGQQNPAAPHFGSWKLISFSGTPFSPNPNIIGDLFPNVIIAAFTNPDAGTVATFEESGKFIIQVTAADEGRYARPVKSKSYLTLTSSRTRRGDTVSFGLREIDESRPDMNFEAGQTQLIFSKIGGGWGVNLQRDTKNGVPHDSLVGVWQDHAIFIDSPQPYSTTLTFTSDGLYTLLLQRNEQGLMELNGDKFIYTGPHFIRNEGKMIYDKSNDRLTFLSGASETVWQRTK